MKLAQALIERKAAFQRVTDLRGRVIENCSKVENEKPTENPVELLEQLEVAVEELGTLINRINKSNNVYEIENNGDTISAAIVRRDMLKLKIDYFQQALTSSNPRSIRSSRYDLFDNENKVRLVPSMDSNYLRKKVDELSKEYRELDTLIQAANWSNDLAD